MIFKRNFCALAMTLAFGVAACAPKQTTPVTNSNGTPANAAEQVAGSAYVAYIGVDTAWLAYLKSGKASQSVVASVEPKRKAARAALDAFAAASLNGDAAAAQTAFTEAEAAFVAALTAAGVKTS